MIMHVLLKIRQEGCRSSCNRYAQTIFLPVKLPSAMSWDKTRFSFVFWCFVFKKWNFDSTNSHVTVEGNNVTWYLEGTGSVSLLFLTLMITSSPQEARSFVSTWEQNDSLIWAQLSSVVPWVGRESMGLPHTACSDRASSRSAFPQTKGGGTGFMAPTQLMECMLVGFFRAFQGAAAALKLINGDKGAQRRRYHWSWVYSIFERALLTGFYSGHGRIQRHFRTRHLMHFAAALKS